MGTVYRTQEYHRRYMAEWRRLHPVRARRSYRRWEQMRAVKRMTVIKLAAVAAKPILEDVDRDGFLRCGFCHFRKAVGGVDRMAIDDKGVFRERRIPYCGEC